jgi:hypothetical protein
MTFLKLFFWIGLGGMAAGVYHQNLPLTLSACTVFLGGIKLWESSVPPIVFFSSDKLNPNKEDTHE